MKTFRNFFAILLATTLIFSGGALSAAAAGGLNTVKGVATLDGVPLGGAHVTLTTSGGTGFFNTVTADVVGYFEFNGLADGTYEGWVEHPSDGNTVTIVPFTLNSGNSPVTINPDMKDWPTGTSTVSGAVTDSVTHLPVTTAHVAFRGLGGAADSDMPVDLSTGGYSVFDLPDGAFQLSVTAAGYVTRSIDFALDADDNLTLNITLILANSTLTVHIASGGVPLANQSFRLARVDGTIMPYGYLTDGAGNFTKTELGAGEYIASAGGGLYKNQDKTVTVVAGAVTNVTFDLEERVVGTISGTVYDENGDPLAGICVGTMTAPGLWGSGFFGGKGVGTDATGTYTLSDVDAGSYRIIFYDECSRSVGRAHAEYALSYFGGVNGEASFADGSAVVSNGDNITGYDIQLVRAGSLSGKVSLQTSDGVKDLPNSRGMDATVYQFAGSVWTAVPDVTSFVGSGSIGQFEVYGLYPGTYRVCFEDMMTGARAFAFECWKDSATVDGANDIVVTAGTLTPNVTAAVGIPRPGFNPVAVPTDQLDSATKGTITFDGTADQGQTIDVDLGASMGGEWFSVWGHSTPTLMGSWVQASPTGVVRATVPRSLAAGTHTLVVQNATGGVIGWNTLQVRGVGGLASTGIEATPALLVGGLGILIGGVLIMFAIRRRRSMV